MHVVGGSEPELIIQWRSPTRVWGLSYEHLLPSVCSGKVKDEEERTVKTSTCIDKKVWKNTAFSCAMFFPSRSSSFQFFILSAWLSGYKNKAGKQRNVAGFCYRFLSIRSSSHPEGKSLPGSTSQYWSSTSVCIRVPMFDLACVRSPDCGASHCHPIAQPAGSFWLGNSICNVH